MFKKDGFELDIEPAQTPRRVCKLLLQSRRPSREERDRRTGRGQTCRERESAVGLDRQGERRRASPGRRGSHVRPRTRLSPPFILRSGPLAGGLSGDSASLRGGSKPASPRRPDVCGTDSGSPGSRQEGPGGSAQPRLLRALSAPAAASIGGAQPRRQTTRAVRFV